MARIFKYLLSIALIMLVAKTSVATHIVGGVINYQHVNNNNYTITLRVYRDCFFGQADFDNPALIGVYDDNNDFITTLSLSNPVVSEVDPPIDNPCLVIPPNICVEEGRYTGTFTVPNANMGYHLVYQRCCRNNTISNVELPVGATYTSYIPPTSLYSNSNPVFKEFPPLFICVNAPLVFDHSAIDADGDSLVYEMCRPFEGGDSTMPLPNPPSPPPFPNVIYNPGFSKNNPLGSTNPLSVDINSGVLTGTPDYLGQFVVGICVSEYRNGVLLSTTIRDFQFNVTTCNIPTSSIPSTNIDPNTQIGDFIEVCEYSTTVNFINQSSGATQYEWYFGDPTTTTDFSTLKNPTWTYQPIPATYLVTLVAINDLGCKDTSKANVIVNPRPLVTLTNDTIICSNSSVQLIANGGIQYQWTPSSIFINPAIQKPVATPPYTGDTVEVKVFVTDNNSCVNSDSMEIIFFKAPDITASKDTSVCLEPNSFRDSVQLFAGGGVSYTWSPDTGLNDPTIYNPVSRPVTNTLYVVTGIDTNGCSATDSVLVYFLDPQLDLIYLEKDEICYKDSTQVDVLDQGIITAYTWSPNYKISDINIREPVFYPLVTTQYILSISNYCYVKQDTVEIIVHPLPLAYVGNLDSVCLGDTIQLNASGGIIYEWEPHPSISDINIPDPFVFPDDTTEYFVTVTDSHGCVATDSIDVLVHLPPEPFTYVDDLRNYICFGQSVVLRSEGGIQYEWKYTVTLTHFSGDSTIATPPDTTKYFVKVSNKHKCTAKDTVQVNVQLPIDPGEDKVFDVCRGLNINAKLHGGLYYEWKPSKFLDYSNIPNPVISPVDDISYSVLISNDCFIDSLNVDVAVHDLPIAEAGPDKSIFRGFSTELEGSGGGDYLWTPAETLNDPTMPFPVAKPIWTTTYSLRVTNEFGCKDFDTVRVTVSSKDILIVPTGFTPNGDGMNDFFRILQHLNVEELLVFRVFNRWGEVVFEGEDLDDEWDGTFRGKTQEMGAYAYLIKYRNFDGDILEEKGNVTLLR